MIKNWFLSFVLPAILLAPQRSSAQSLSSALGAPKLDGLKNFSDCMDQVHGKRENLIGERMEAKLAVSTSLTPQERDIWAADIKALRQVTPTRPYQPPDASNPQHYMLGLTDQEQVSINSMYSRFTQEVNLKCEHLYGGMTRYSPGVDQSGQVRYEQGLKDQMKAPIDISTIPVTPLPSPFPKSRAQMQEERRAANRARQQAMAQTESNCIDSTKGLRLSLMADKMQQRLDNSKGLSAKERADFQADIQATRDAAAKKLDYAPPVDPKNPNRALMRLTTQDQMDLNTEFSQQLISRMQNCAHNSALSRTPTP
jgi:hypothetical protein